MSLQEKLDLAQLLSLFVAQSNEGYAIFDQSDSIIYANQLYADIVMGTKPKNITGKTFATAITEAYQDKRGIRIKINKLDSWLKKSNQSRWQELYRSTEVELFNGRWALISEQIIGGKFLFVHATDITYKKALEKELLVAKNKLTTQAYKDDLTGISNRRDFVEKANSEISKALRHKKTLILFMMDIDYFKQINDQNGHVAGDKIVRSIAQLVKLQLREYDIFARIGGDEFALLFSDANVESTILVVSRIKEIIKNTDFEFNQKPVNCTVSFGGCVIKLHDNLETFMERADENLYKAKRSGRNKVIFR